MAKEISPKLRKEVEAIIYQFFDILDKTKTNSEHYKKKFAKMDNKQFMKFISLKFPYRFHQKPFVIEPTMTDIREACDFIGVPLMETVYFPYLYKNADGLPVESEREQYVVYLPLKKMQQFLTHKNSMSTEIDLRDMKTGLLTSSDKNGKTSDRELESLIVLGLDNCTEEFSKFKADAMQAKNKAYNTINTIGKVSLQDVRTDEDDSLSRNLLNTYLLGAHIKSNIISNDYLLPYTLKTDGERRIRKV